MNVKNRYLALILISAQAIPQMIEGTYGNRHAAQKTIDR